MNDNFQIFSPIQPKSGCHCAGEMKNITNQLNILQQEIIRLERRILTIEKSLISPSLNNLKPTPMEYNNLNYTNENYII